MAGGKFYISPHISAFSLSALATCSDMVAVAIYDHYEACFSNDPFNESFSFSNYRFSPTRTPSPWDGIRKSDKFSAVCPQRMPNVQNEQEALKKMPKGRLEYLKRLLPFLQNQSEDCLYLNVFSPLHGKPNHFTLLPLLYQCTLNALVRVKSKKKSFFSYYFYGLFLKYN